MVCIAYGLYCLSSVRLGPRELFLVEVFHRKTPRRVLAFRISPALRARLDVHFGQALEYSCFFETPMTSFFHRTSSRSSRTATSEWHLCHCINTPRPLGVVRREHEMIPGTAVRPDPYWIPRLTSVAAVSYRAMSDELDVQAMLERFRTRARAVRQRGIPPVEGAERKRFIDQARIDFQDFAIIGDAQGQLEDGILTLTVDLRPGDPEVTSGSDRPS